MPQVDFTLEDLKQVFATKEDIVGLATNEDIVGLATKEDLVGLATKEDLESFATKEDLESFARKEDLESFATMDGVNSLRVDMLLRFEDIMTILKRLDKRTDEDTVANMGSIEEVSRRSLKTARQVSAHVADTEAHGGKDGRSH